MKKLLFLLFFVLASLATMAQTLPYRPYAEFKGNIGAYLKYNFDDRGNLYQKKTFGDLLKDIEVTPIAYFPTLAESKTDCQTYVLEICIIFKRKTLGQFSPIYDEYLSVHIEEPWFLWNELKNQYRRFQGERWTQDDYNILSNKRIKSVLYKYI